jgi:hypothetical protein
MGTPITPDLITFLGAHRAHVALYADGRPTAIIELKVFDETTPLPTVGSGIDKAQMLQRLGTLQIFVGVMICPITLSLEARIERPNSAARGGSALGRISRRITHIKPSPHSVALPVSAPKSMSGAIQRPEGGSMA